MYFGEAAKYWDKYLQELNEAGSSNLLTNTIETLELSAEYVDALIKPYKHVNIVNICIGNNMGLRKTLGRLQRQGKLRRFIGIDISESILDLSGRNVIEWFNGSIQMEKYLLDIRGQSFGDIMAADTFGDDASKTVNLIFFVAGPIVNFKDPHRVLRTINGSMNKNDVLFTSLKRNTPRTRQFFDFNIKSDSSLLGQHHKILLDQIGVDESLYELEQGIDETEKRRYVRIHLKSSMSIRFETGNFQKTIHFIKGESILLWKSKLYYDQDIIDVFREADFSPVHISQSLDRELNLLISKINTDK